jgi:small-conductance mechanosensitive channel
LKKFAQTLFWTTLHPGPWCPLVTFEGDQNRAPSRGKSETVKGDKTQKPMEDFNLRIIETVVVLTSYGIIRVAITRSIDKVAKRFAYQKQRIKITKKIIRTFVFLLFFGLLLFIWGVEQSELIIFISSLLTILAIAFVAQWSIISNITSTLIVFFAHPAKIGDTITVLDKDFQIEGRISDIGVFFIVITTVEEEKITIPSNIFMQKMVKRKPAD